MWRGDDREALREDLIWQGSDRCSVVFSLMFQLLGPYFLRSYGVILQMKHVVACHANLNSLLSEIRNYFLGLVNAVFNKKTAESWLYSDPSWLMRGKSREKYLDSKYIFESEGRELEKKTVKQPFLCLNNQNSDLLQNISVNWAA